MQGIPCPRACVVARAVGRMNPLGSEVLARLYCPLASNHCAARQVAWILHSSSEKEALPWHRIVNSQGKISLESGHGFEVQKELLRKEGIQFGENGRIDFDNFLWEASIAEQYRILADQ